MLRDGSPPFFGAHLFQVVKWFAKCSPNLLLVLRFLELTSQLKRVEYEISSKTLAKWSVRNMEGADLEGPSPEEAHQDSTIRQQKWATNYRTNMGQLWFSWFFRFMLVIY